MPKTMTVRVVGGGKRRGRRRYGGGRPRGFPRSKFGAVYMPRGTPEGIARFGETYALATGDQLAARRETGWRGRGLYSGRGGFWSDLWKSSKGVRGAIGKYARSQKGWVGTLGRMSAAGGFGDYAVSNDIVNDGGGAPEAVPSFGEGPNEVVISHKEYVCDIFGPETAGIFQNQTFSLNPALPTTFPWLSQVAANYDEYEFGQMIFTFKSTVTDFVAANGQVGSMILTTQYNANDAPFQSKQDAMEYDGAVSGKVSEMILAGVECDPTLNSGTPGKYTRSGPPPPDEDIKTYDLGTLNVAVSNTPDQFSNQALGELWVSYTVKLRKPKFFVTRGQNILKDIWVGNSAIAVTADALTYGLGQQNRIGGNLLTSYIGNGTSLVPDYPATAGRLYYVLPHTFSGEVETSCVAITTTGQAAGLVSQSNLSGNGLQAINDIWSSSGWVSGSGAFPKAHFKVTSPTSAQTSGAADNVLIINVYVAPPPAAPTVAYVTSLQFDIQVYNTGFNYARSHQPIVENPSTGLVETWP